METVQPHIPMTPSWKVTAPSALGQDASIRRMIQTLIPTYQTLSWMLGVTTDTDIGGDDDYIYP
jgi:hypothetical protein